VAGNGLRAPRGVRDSGKGRRLPDYDRERTRRVSERADDRPNGEGEVLLIEILPRDIASEALSASLAIDRSAKFR